MKQCKWIAILMLIACTFLLLLPISAFAQEHPGRVMEIQTESPTPPMAPQSYQPYKVPEGEIEVTNQTSGGFNWIVTGGTGTVHYVSVGKNNIQLNAINWRDEDKETPSTIVFDTIENNASGITWQETGQGFLTDNAGSVGYWSSGVTPGSGTIKLLLNDKPTYANDGGFGSAFNPVDTYAIEVVNHNQETSSIYGGDIACAPNRYGKGNDFEVEVSTAGLSNLSLYQERIEEDMNNAIWRQDGQIIPPLPFTQGEWIVQADNTYGFDRLMLCFKKNLYNTVITVDIPIILQSGGEFCVTSRAAFTISAAGANSMTISRTQVGL